MIILEYILITLIAIPVMVIAGHVVFMGFCLVSAMLDRDEGWMMNDFLSSNRR